jgi:TRAP-type C4-dicarboxylate transport system substrate-binding protein
MRRLAPLLASWLLAVPGSAVTLKIATLAPEGSSWMREMRAAGQTLEEASEGRVRLKFYPGGVMGNDATVLRKMRAGQLQGGAFASGALTQAFPDVDLYSLPLVFRSYDEVDHVRAALDPTLIQGLERAGYVALGLPETGFAYLMSQTPVRSVDDLKGARVWIREGDAMSQTALGAAGVTPVQLPLADVYTALQTGLVDTVAAPPAAAIAFQWHTKVRFLTDVPLMYLIGVFALDARAFGRIGAEDQALLRRVAGEAVARLDREGRAGESEAREALRAQGVTFVDPASAEELARWRSISDRAVAELRQGGVYSEALIDRLLALLADYRSAGGGDH